MRADERASTRAYPRFLGAAAALLLAVRIATGVYDATYPSAPKDLVHWTSAGAAPGPGSTAKPLLFSFSATWCRPCKRMEQEVFADPQMATLINKEFVCIRVDDSDERAEARVLRQKYKIDGVPTLVITMPGDEPTRLEGYPGRRATMDFLKGGLTKVGR